MGRVIWCGPPGYDTGVVIRPGVVLTEDMVSLDPSQWGVDSDNDDSRTATLNVEVSGPGKLATWAAEDDNSDPYERFGSATNGFLNSGVWYVDPGSYPWFAKFSELGTYSVDFDGAIANDNGTPTDTTDDTIYSIAERTYVFHVGPMSDLEVRDAGSGDVAAGRAAYTILAANNGPENAADPEVKIALPPDALVEDYVASEGTYSVYPDTRNLYPGMVRHYRVAAVKPVGRGRMVRPSGVRRNRHSGRRHPSNRAGSSGAAALHRRGPGLGELYLGPPGRRRRADHRLRVPGDFVGRNLHDDGHVGHHPQPG